MYTFADYKTPIQEGIRLPHFKPSLADLESVGLKEGADNYELLRKLCFQGVQKLGIDKLPNYDKYIARTKHELKTLKDLCLVDYMLIVWDFINFANKNSIPLGNGRGCLDGENLVYFNGKYDSIRNIVRKSSADSFSSDRNGDIGKISHYHEYDCKEKLIGIKTWYSTHQVDFFTSDHHVLALKNPFEYPKNRKSGVKNIQETINSIKNNDLQWISAKDVKIDDFLVRKINKFKNTILCEKKIDLSPYSDRFDDEFIYENLPLSTPDPLNIRTISSKGIHSRNYLKDLKHHKTEPSEKILNYFKEIGSSLEEFRSHPTSRVRKLPRYIEVNKDFMYFLGFFIGDGSLCTGLNSFGLAFHSEDNKNELEKISKYFIGYDTNSIKHKEKKLIQFIVKSKSWARFLSGISPNGSNFKKIPEKFLSCDADLLQSLFIGLMESDGHQSKKKTSFDNTSLELIFQVRDLAEFFGYKTSIQKRIEHGCAPSYKINISKQARLNTKGFFKDGFLFLKVRDILEKYSDGKVYDLTIEKEPSYHTSNYIVHNSVGGCLAAYLIGITKKIDPIKYSLYFERFLSVDRVQPKEINGEIFLKDCADIDVDISYYRRHEVIDYLNSKYVGQTAQIMNLSTLSGKLCVKECCKIVGGFNEDDAQNISNLVEKTFGNVNPLKQVYEEVSAFKEWADSNPRIYRVARKLENLNKNYGVHASGLAISPDKRESLFPCHKTKEGQLVTSWEMGPIGNIAVKIDCLGLRTLDLLAVAEKESGVNISDINPEDPTIYKQFENLDHKYGLFQIETDAGYRITKQIAPTHFGQLSDIVAINRPGAIAFLKDYLDYQRGEKPIPKVHPVIDEILKDTGGVLLMQEQTMRILHEVYQFTLVEANQVRKIIGKKLKKDVLAWEGKIRERGDQLKIDVKITDWYWGAILASADYQFNACLGANTAVKCKDCDKNIEFVKIGDMVRALDVSKDKDIYVRVINIYRQKAAIVKILVKIPNGDYREILCSLEHKFLTYTDGANAIMQPIAKTLTQNKLIVTEWGPGYPYFMEIVGYNDSWDLEVDHPDHNFYADGMVVSNSHSRAYSYITAYCAYYKANYPKQFFLGALKLAMSESKPQDIIGEICQELPRFGIKLLPPDLTKSSMDFAIEGENIRYGLSAIKGISEKTFENLQKFRDTEKPTKFGIFMAAKQAGLSIGVLAALIQAGTLDNFGTGRPRLVLEAQVFNKLTDREKALFSSLVDKYAYDAIAIIKACESEKLLDPKGKPILTDRRIVKLRKDCIGYFNIFKLNNSKPKLTAWWFEKQLLGYAYSVKLAECFDNPLNDYSDFKRMENNESAMFVGEVAEVTKAVSKAKGNPYMKIMLSSETGIITCMMMDNKRKKPFAEFVESGAKMPEEGDLLLVWGSKFNDAVFCDNIKVVSETIYTKFTQLKDDEKSAESSEI